MYRLINLLLLLPAICLGQTVSFPQTSSATPAAPTTSVQYNNGSFGGATNVGSDGINLVLTKTPNPPTVSSGQASLFYEQMGGANVLSVKHPNDMPVGLQNSPLDVLYGYSIAAGNGSTTIVSSGSTLPVAGTASSDGFSSSHSGALEQARNVAYNGSSTANSFAGIVYGAAPFLIGNATLGGFYVSLRAANGTSTASSRFFMGMKVNTGAPAGTTTTDNILNFFGFGSEVGDANHSIIYNDGAGTTTKINLGSNFPTRPTASHWYQLELWGRNSTVTYVITNLETGNMATGTLTTNIPANNVGLCPIILVNNGSSGVVPNLKFEKLYYEIR